MKKDPIKRLYSELIAAGIASPDELKAIEQKVEAKVNAAVEFAEKSPDPPAENALKDIFYEGPPQGPEPSKNELGNRVISMREAINEAMRQEMFRDRRS